MIKNRIESFAKYAGFATVGVEWLALLLYYVQLPSYFGGQYPISYFATLPQTKFVFTICYTLAGIFFWIFIRHHLHKIYNVPVKLIGFSMIFFVGLALTPYNPENFISDTIHRTLGLTSLTLFLIGFYRFAKRAKNTYIFRGTMVTIIVSFALVLAFFLSPKDSHLIFAFEAGSWFIWQIWVLWISFYSYKHKALK